MVKYKTFLEFFFVSNVTSSVSKKKSYDKYEFIIVLWVAIGSGSQSIFFLNRNPGLDRDPKKKDRDPYSLAIHFGIGDPDRRSPTLAFKR